MEEMLETVVCAPRRAEESASEPMSDSEDESADEIQEDYQANTNSRLPSDDTFKTSLQVLDLQTLEMDCASSPYSYAFRIDAFTRKVSATGGDFQSLGQGKFLRQDTAMTVNLEAPSIDSHLANYLVDYYFRELWPLFPIIDKDAIYGQLRDRRPSPPAGLMAAIYLASASTIAQASHHPEVHSPGSSSALSPRTPSTLPPGLLDSLRSSLTRMMYALSTPILEPRITTLQSLVLSCLYDNSLLSEQRIIMISDATRIAQKILLHRLVSNIPPRDKSLRKHLWWTIFLLEVWTAARDRIPCGIDLREVDAPQLIESEEPEHQVFTAIVALTRILLDTLHRLYSPTVRPEDVSAEATRIRGWLMDWYCNLPNELLPSGSASGSETADFLLLACHGVLLLVYSPFRGEDLVRSEIERSRGIITEALGKLGRNIGKFGIIASLVGEMARRSA